MTVICTRPTTPESRKRHVETFGEKPDRYCKRCRRLPAWCECLAQRMGERIFGEQPVNHALAIAYSKKREAAKKGNGGK